MFGWFSVFFFGVTAVLFGQRMFLTAVGHNLGVCLVFYLCVLCVCTNAFFYLCAFVLVMLMCMFVRVMLMCMFVRVVLMCMGEISGPKTRSA